MDVKRESKIETKVKKRKKNKYKITNNWWWIALKIYTLRVYSILTRVWISFTFKYLWFSAIVCFPFSLKKNNNKTFIFIIQFKVKKRRNSNGASELSHLKQCLCVRRVGETWKKMKIIFSRWKHVTTLIKRKWIWQRKIEKEKAYGRDRDREIGWASEQEMVSEIGLKIPSVIINKYLS